MILNPLLYLTYGSNLHPSRLIERVGPVECAGKVCLPGWKLMFDKRGSDGSAKANLRAAPGSDADARAALYELDQKQYSILDRFEGAGRGYDSFWMDVIVDGEERSAVTYLTPSHWRAETARPWTWYRDLVVAGARFHGFPESYVQVIEQVKASPDPDAERAARHDRILQNLG